MLSYARVILIIALLLCGRVYAGPETVSREDRIKAAFVYNFAKFVVWPDEAKDDRDKPVVIGVLGNTPIYSALDALAGKKIKKRTVVCKRLKTIERLDCKELESCKEKDKRLDDLYKCRILFVANSEKKKFSKLSSICEQQHILTIGSSKDFLETGGIFNFVIKDNKVRFKVNAAAAKRAKLEVSSKVLRLALHVLKQDKKSSTSQKEKGVKE